MVQQAQNNSSYDVVFERTQWPKRARFLRALTTPEAVKAEQCRRSFYYFLHEFWDTVCTDDPIWNWHMEVICEELEKVLERVIKHQTKAYDLVINIPPGTTKSIICSVLFAPWAWSKAPWLRFINVSYAADLSLEFGQRARDCVKSAKYKAYFPEIQIRRTEDTKSSFRLEEVSFASDGTIVQRKLAGGRLSTSVGGTGTGFHAHIIMVDDALNPQQAVSDKDVKTANDFISQTLSTRKVDKAVTPTIHIAQRLRKDDPPGTLLKKAEKEGLSIRHICLPGDIKGDCAEVKPKCFKKKYIDGLLDPIRLSRAVLKNLKIELGQYGFLAQIQQSPRKATAGMFQIDRIETVPPIPRNQIIHSVRYWDKAATQDGGAYTCGCRMAEVEIEGKHKIAILHMERGQWATHMRERRIKTIAEMDGPDTYVYLEQEPGSGGKDSVMLSLEMLESSAPAYADRPIGDKIYRADPFSVRVNNGDVVMVEGAWNQDCFDELSDFPESKYKDQVDSMSGAYMKIQFGTRAGVW